MTEEIKLTTEVLNCDYFNRNRGFNCYKGKNCTEVPDCYYRQLKRLEQENKELKEQAQLDGECIDKLIEARDMYAKALEEINITVKQLLKGVSSDCINNTPYLTALRQPNFSPREAAWKALLKPMAPRSPSPW